MDYLTLSFPYLPGPDPRQAAADAVLSGAERLAASLGAYRFGRRAEIKAQELRKRCIERFNAERVRRGIPHE